MTHLRVEVLLEERAERRVAEPDPAALVLAEVEQRGENLEHLQ